ncbi:hypothetical protein TIFTF001_044979 [Ficus carica]|uniref:Uncharacterized protein n=1 Tax=Ficus carica TaxID=3494 RepID=A0AA88CY52_FICCA|nr:hypothetical protein TIFTF001_044977 [Ficus carica]GMN35081.1 hypothetical protein TIFTF001_044979 [Ficus carica]
MEAQQDEFDKFRQGNLSVAEAVKKFEQLARLCLTSSVPKGTKAIRAEYWVGQNKE